MSQLRYVLGKRGTQYVATSATIVAILLSVIAGALSPWFALLAIILGGYILLRMSLVDHRRRRNAESRPNLREHPRVKSTLLPHEQVLEVTREHPISILWGCMQASIATGGRGIFIIAWLFRTTKVSKDLKLPLNAIFTAVAVGVIGNYVGGPQALLGLVVTLALLAIVLSIAWRIWVYKADLLVLTNWRIYVLNGTLSRSYEIIDLDKVYGVNYRVTAVSRMLTFLKLIEENYGSINAQGIGDIADRFKRTPRIYAFNRRLQLAVYAKQIEAAAQNK